MKKLKDIFEEVTNPNELLEALASLEHDQWVTWASDLMEKENLSEERVNRWENECMMPYENLSEKMKEFDREWARKVIKIYEEYA